VGPISPDDFRVRQPLFTIGEAAVYLDMSESTLRWWASQENLVARIPTSPRRASIPFIGLAEGLVLSAFREAGLPLQRIRPALLRLRDEIGLEHALASQSLYTDGAEIIYDYAEKHEDVAHLGDLTVVRSGQRVFGAVIETYLRRISYARDGWPNMVKLPRFKLADVIVDPRRAFGQPIFAHGAVRIEDVVDRWRAGDSMKSLAVDFGVPLDEVEDVLRVA
jgi:uncharacterized protein (DUF433 family)/DNA-binding transcriptional MerR regulator